MKRRVNSSWILASAAGLWLRCFLGAAISIGLSLCAVSSLNAQVDVPGPERLSHVAGYIVDPTGHPVANLDVGLFREEKAAYEARTGKNGEFQFDRVKGPYTFRVARSQYSAATRELVVTDEIVTALEKKKLYVILGPGACKDECSSVLTSKREFDRAVRERNKH